MISYTREEFLESQVHSIQLDIDKLQGELERLQNQSYLSGPEFMLLSKLSDQIADLESEIKELHDEYQEELTVRERSWRDL